MYGSALADKGQGSVSRVASGGAVFLQHRIAPSLMNPPLFITLNCGRSPCPRHQIYYIWDSSPVKINTGKKSYPGLVSAYVILNMHPRFGQLITRIVGRGHPVTYSSREHRN
jgi:hypothetical protein